MKLSTRLVLLFELMLKENPRGELEIRVLTQRQLIDAYNLY